MFNKIDHCDLCGADKFSQPQMLFMALTAGLISLAANSAVRSGLKAIVSAKQNGVNITPKA